MLSPEDKKYFEVLNQTFSAPIFFFLGIVLLLMSFVSITHAPHHGDFIVLGCLLFILGYNALRFGKILKS
jgi:hypothetical protein